MKSLLSISNLHVEVAKKPVLNGVNLVVNSGELHVLMGPNGSGKSTLANALAGHPLYHISAGEASIGDQDLMQMSPDLRAKAGLFLAFQYPVAVPGVSVGNFLRKAYESLHASVPKDFRQQLYKELALMNLDKSFAARSLNDGFSGGEKKRLELVQMALLKPKVVILDEIDSGLDIDGISLVSKAINSFLSKNNAVIMITHYARVLEQITPTSVHIMQNGVISKSGDVKLAYELEKSGYL